jgi:hypothetical protein
MKYHNIIIAINLAKVEEGTPTIYNITGLISRYSPLRITLTRKPFYKNIRKETNLEKHLKKSDYNANKNGDFATIYYWNPCYSPQNFFVK